MGAGGGRLVELPGLGGVTGGVTPGGQCQWSSWASQVGAGGGRLVAPAPLEEGAGGVAGGVTPGGQCQWSSCGSHVPVVTVVGLLVVERLVGGAVGDGSQCPVFRPEESQTPV